MTSARDKLVDAVRSVPYSLRLVAVVLIFNGMFALIKSATILIGNDVDPDWRVVNIIIGFGLILKKRYWYFAAIMSVVVFVGIHIQSMAVVVLAYQAYGMGGIIYLAVALIMDLAMLYVLLRPQTLNLYFVLKGKQ